MSFQLGIDSSTRYASVAISKDGHIQVELSWHSDQNHSVELAPALRRVIEHAGIQSSDIDGIFVAQGPGGFSAVRVGLSTAKALAFARDIPLVGINTLEIEAVPYIGLGMPVHAIIPAGRKFLYNAVFPSEDGFLEPKCRVVSIEDLISGLNEHTIYCGEATSLLIEQATNKNLLISRDNTPTRKPSSLAKLGFLRLKTGGVVDPAKIQPIYMRGSQYEIADQNRGIS